MSKILQHTSFLSILKSFNLDRCNHPGQILSYEVEETVRYKEIQAGLGVRWEKARWFHFLSEQNKGKDGGHAL